MAIRLEVHPYNVQIVGITADEQSRMVLAEAVYAKMAAAGIWTDADSKNRVVVDILNALEVVHLGLTKVLDESADVNDVMYTRVIKGITDTVAQEEALRYALTRGFSDTISPYETVQLDLTRSDTDTVGTQDAPPYWTLNKHFTDSVTTGDTTMVSKVYILEFIDTLLTDDASGFSMLINRGRDADSMNVSDASNWSINKITVDTISGVSDSFSKQTVFHRAITDTISDVSDSLSTQTVFHRSITDTISLTETVRVDEPQYFGEGLGLQDAATIVHTIGAFPILNNMQLNQSTLG